MDFREVEVIINEGNKFKKALAAALIGTSLASGVYAKSKKIDYSDPFKGLTVREKVAMNGGGVATFAADSFETLNNKEIKLADKIVKISFEDIKTVSIDECEMFGKLIVKTEQEKKELNISFNITIPHGTSCKIVFFINNKKQDTKYSDYRRLTQTIKNIIIDNVNN